MEFDNTHAQYQSLSQEQSTEFLMKGGQHCPFCQSNGAENVSETPLYEMGYLTLFCVCEQCHNKWRARFKLVDIKIDHRVHV